MIIVMQQQPMCSQQTGKIFDRTFDKERNKGKKKPQKCMVFKIHRETSKFEETSKSMLYRRRLRNLQLSLPHTKKNAE